jgi:hypothetical protein
MAVKVSPSHFQATHSIAEPSDAIEYLTRIQEIFNRMTFLDPTTQSFHDERSHIFHYLTLIDRKAPFSNVPNFTDDLVWLRADQIVYGSLFTQFPGSEGRLMPLAETYIQNFKTLKELAQMPSQSNIDTLKTLVSKIISTHTKFLDQYSLEMETACKDQHDVVAYTHRTDIVFFIDAFINSLRLSSIDELNEIGIKLGNCEGEFAFQFAILALEHALKADGYNLPKVFMDHQAEFDLLNHSYQALSSKDKTAVSLALQGKQDSLSPQAKKVVRSIKKKAIRWQRDPAHASLNSALLLNVYKEAVKTTYLIKHIKEVIELLPSDFMMKDRIPRIRFEVASQLLFFAGLLCNEDEASFDGIDKSLGIRLKNLKRQIFDNDHQGALNAAMGIDPSLPKTSRWTFVDNFKVGAKYSEFTEDSKIFNLIICGFIIPQMIQKPPIASPVASPAKPAFLKVIDDLLALLK